MANLESSAFPLAAGSSTIFAISAVLRSLTWALALTALAVTVAAWSLRAPVITGVALGVVAWLFLTGFDVNADGVLRFSGGADAARAGVLIGAALAAAAAGRIWAWYGQVRGEPASGTPPRRGVRETVR